MVLGTCLCIKKNAIQSIHYSYGFPRRMTCSTPRYTRFYSNSSLLLRHPTLSLPLPRLQSSTSFNASLQYPSLLHTNKWRFMSAKAMSYGNDSLDFDYETNGNDVAPIERLASATQHYQSIQDELSSVTPFDPTALRSHLDVGRLDDALALVLRSGGLLDYPAKDRRLLFTSLGDLSTNELAKLLEPWIQQQRPMQQDKRLIQLLKYLGSNLPTDLLQHLLHQFPSDYCVQSSLFSSLVKDYMASQSDGEPQLDIMLSYLNLLSNNNVDIKTRLYNMALNGCLKRKTLDHVDKVLTQMKSSGCSLDAASFNMLIRSRLETGDVDAANGLYHQLIDSQVTPTTATFNTFIKYACEQQHWDRMGLWLDRLMDKGQAQLEPNRVTLRILVAALTGHIDQPAVVEAFQRVASAVQVIDDDLERTIHTSIVHLLRQKHTDTALDILRMLFNRPPSLEHHQLSIYSYNLFIHALVQKGDVDAADQVLVSMQNSHSQLGKNTVARRPLPDIVSYTTLIHGYIRSANSNDINIRRISTLYQELMANGLETNATLQAVILYGMVKSGFQDIEEYTHLFESMVEDHDDDGSEHARFLDSSYGRHMNPKASRMTMYNIMMDGYFLHHYYGRFSTSSSASIQKHVTAINGRDHHIPPEPLALLNRAIENGLPLTTATLNIWIRGLALFNHDLMAAESMVKWMTLTHGVKMNERTVYYLVRTAIRQDRRDKARKWISLYEKNGQTIQGSGLQYFKNMVVK